MFGSRRGGVVPGAVSRSRDQAGGPVPDPIYDERLDCARTRAARWFVGERDVCALRVGTGTATFLPGNLIPGLGREFFFDHAVFAFENQVTPEPGTLLLVVIPVVLSAKVRRAWGANVRRGAGY